MAKVTLRRSEWIAVRDALIALSRKKNKTHDFGFRLRRMLRVLVPLAEDIEEQKDDIVDSFLKRDEDGKPVQVGEGYAMTDGREADRSMRRFMRTEHTEEIPFEMIRKSELESEGIVLNGWEMFNLNVFLVDPEITRDGVDADAEIPPPDE